VIRPAAPAARRRRRPERASRTRPRDARLHAKNGRDRQLLVQLSSLGVDGRRARCCGNAVAGVGLERPADGTSGGSPSGHDDLQDHAEYAGQRASIAVDGTLLAGTLPARALRLVPEWARTHEEKLSVNWTRAREYEIDLPRFCGHV
jgi:hypothetical protein